MSTTPQTLRAISGETVIDRLYERHAEESKLSTEEGFSFFFNTGFSKITKKIMGQDRVLNDIKKKLFATLWAISRKKQERPRTFVFLGNSTTGKTEMARRIGETMFGDFCLIPMSNFSSEHEKSMIVGTSSGYKGYEDPTVLERYISENKSGRYCIIFDEMEKAPREIYSFLLNLLDTGVMKLLNGRTIDLKNSIIIFTGNVGVERTRQKIGFSDGSKNTTKVGDAKAVDSGRVMEALKEFLPIETLNRIGRDNVYVFNDLNAKHKESIYQSYLAEQLESLNIKVGKRMSAFVQKKMSEIATLDASYSIREIKERLKDELILKAFYPKEKKIKE